MQAKDGESEGHKRQNWSMGEALENEQMGLFVRKYSQGVRGDLREEKGSFQQEFTNSIFQT